MSLKFQQDGSATISNVTSIFIRPIRLQNSLNMNSNGAVLKYEEHCDNNYKLKRFVFLQHLYSLATKILTLNDKHQSLNLFVILHKLVSITYVQNSVDKARL